MIYYVYDAQLVINLVNVTKKKHFDINELLLVRKTADAVRCLSLIHI